MSYQASVASILPVKKQALLLVQLPHPVSCFLFFLPRSINKKQLLLFLLIDTPAPVIILMAVGDAIKFEACYVSVILAHRSFPCVVPDQKTQ